MGKLSEKYPYTAKFRVNVSDGKKTVCLGGGRDCVIGIPGSPPNPMLYYYTTCPWVAHGTHSDKWNKGTLEEIDSRSFEEYHIHEVGVPKNRVLLLKPDSPPLRVLSAGEACLPHDLRHGTMLSSGETVLIYKDVTPWYVHNISGSAKQWEALSPALVPRTQHTGFARTTWVWLIRSGIPEPTARKLMNAKICGPQCAYAAVYWEKKAHETHTDWALVPLVIGFLELLRQAHLKVEFVNSACKELDLPRPRNGWQADDSTQRIFAGVLELMKIPRRRR